MVNYSIVSVAQCLCVFYSKSYQTLYNNIGQMGHVFSRMIAKLTSQVVFKVPYIYRVKFACKIMESLHGKMCKLAMHGRSKVCHSNSSCNEQCQIFSHQQFEFVEMCPTFQHPKDPKFQHAVLIAITDAHLEPCRTSTMEFFLKQLTTFSR